MVVDTDVVSFVFKQDSRAARYEIHLLGKELVLSAQTRAELFVWAEFRNWSSRRRRDLENFLTRYVVEYPTEETCRLYGELVAKARKGGFSVPHTDAWQAATAISLGVPLVTHNARNYQGIPNLTLITEQD